MGREALWWKALRFATSTTNGMSTFPRLQESSKWHFSRFFTVDNSATFIAVAGRVQRVAKQYPWSLPNDAMRSAKSG